MGSYEYFREGRSEKWDPLSLERALSIADVYIANLRLKPVSYASLGWVEVIGKWNPIKVIADMVIRWRQQRLDLEIARLQAETERMRMENDLMKNMVEILRDMAGNGRGNATATVSAWIKDIPPQLEQSVLAIASDPRITDVKAVAQ